MIGYNEKIAPIETRLKVLSWNIWWRFGPWEARRPAIAASLKQIDADIIALQEVWSEGQTNLAAELGKELGYHHVYAASMHREKIGFGNAILSRWPIAQTDHVMLSGSIETDERRLVIYAQIDGPRGQIAFFNTHLNWKYQHSHIRQQQVRDITHFINAKTAQAFPPVLCGDFNAAPDSEEMRMLKGLTTCPVKGLFFHDAWCVAGDGGPGYTWDNKNPYAVAEFEPDRRIDYILAGAPGKGGAGHFVDCRVTGNEPVDDVWPSDHHAVLAHLRY